LKIFHLNESDFRRLVPTRKTAMPRDRHCRLSFWFLLELGGGVVNAGQTFAGHCSSPFDHLAGDDKFLHAFL
jgi:hypothetical protein